MYAWWMYIHALQISLNMNEIAYREHQFGNDITIFHSPPFSFPYSHYNPQPLR